MGVLIVATERVALATGRRLADLMNYLLPGKRRAAMLLVANERTRAARPRGVSNNVAMLVENGVDLALALPHIRRIGVRWERLEGSRCSGILTGKTKWIECWNTTDHAWPPAES